MEAFSSAVGPCAITSLAVILLSTHALIEREQIFRRGGEVLDVLLEMNNAQDPLQSLMDEKRLQYAKRILDYVLVSLAVNLAVFLPMCCLIDMRGSYAVALVWCMFYTMLLWVKFSGVEPTLGLANVVSSAVHIIIILRTIESGFTPAEIDCVAFVPSLRCLSRVLLGVATLDRKKTISWSVMHTIANMWSQKQRHLGTLVMFSELSVSAGIVGLAFCVEALARQQILEACNVESLSNAKESLDSEKATVMRLLSAFCDAKVQLGADYQIQGDHAQLAQLLKSTSPGRLDNLDFASYLSPGDATRVRDFVSTSITTKQANDGTQQGVEPPISLQVELRDSAGIFFKARLYFASSCNTSGEQFLLMGICEESSEPRQEALSEVLLEELRVAESQRTEMARRLQRSARSGSSSASRPSTLFESTAVDVEELESVQIGLDPLTAGCPINSCTIKFADEQHELSPNLKDWVYKKDYQALSDWVQEQLNSFYSDGTYSTDPFANLRLYHPGAENTRHLLLAEQVRFDIVCPEDGSECNDSSSVDGESDMSEIAECTLLLTGLKRTQAAPKTVRSMHRSSRQAAPLPSIQEGMLSSNNLA